MVTEPTSTVRVKRLRERRSRGVAMVAPVEVGEGGIALLVSSGLFEKHETRDRKAAGHAFGATSVARFGTTGATTATPRERCSRSLLARAVGGGFSDHVID